jgi:hypothetical protein
MKETLNERSIAQRGCSFRHAGPARIAVGYRSKVLARDDATLRRVRDARCVAALHAERNIEAHFIVEAGL